MKKNYRFSEEIKFQNNNAEKYAVKRETDFIWEVPEQLFLLKKEYFKKGITVVDMGCGPSVAIKNIISRNILKNLSYVGVDISENMLKHARKNIPSGKFICGDISNVFFDKQSADVIISLGALHHAQDKIKTLEHWLGILKKKGLIMMREPTYAALRLGDGESPIEEGVKVKDVLKFINSKKARIQSLIYFNSPAFHFFNRVMIKIGLEKWQEIKFLWYPVVLLDVSICKSLFSLSKFFKGEAFILIVKKL